ncbi:MAG: tyrosine-type recombinase/integrase, partial [Deltaproteobacteria bacterium]|nr:tyrosine-type recombinase/integrase [Deltaproteobacteria bacterium]
MGYADNTKRPPRTLTEIEQARLLKVTGEHRSGFRDHVLFAVALGTGLRVAEIVALDVGDVSPDGKRVRRRVTLRVFKRSLRDGGAQEVFLPD